MRISCVYLFACIAFSFAAHAQSSTADPLHQRVFHADKKFFNGVQWKFKTKGKIFSTPAQYNGLLIFGSGDSTLYALQKETGVQKWKVKTQGAIHSSPLIFQDKVYAGSFDGYYYCLDATSGTVKWKFKTGGERWPGGKGYFGWKPDTLAMNDPWDYFLSTPVIGTDETGPVIYFGSSDTNVYAVDAVTGELRWKFKTNGIVHTTPVLHNGLLFVGSWDTYLYALNALNGKLIWKFRTGENPGMTGIQSSPVVALNSIYFGARDAKLYCIDERTSNARWKYDAENAWILSTPVVDGTKIFVGTSDTYLLLNVDALSGKEVWRSKLKGYVFGTPCVTDSSVFIGDFSGRIYSIDKSDGKIIDMFLTDAHLKNATGVLEADGSMNFQKLAKGKDQSLYSTVVDAMDQLYSVGPVVSSGVISNNVLFIGSSDGTMYAIKLGRTKKSIP